MQKKPNWIPEMSWLHLVNLSNTLPIFKDLPDSVVQNEALWREWFDLGAPEDADIPVSHASLCTLADAHACIAMHMPACTHQHACTGMHSARCEEAYVLGI